MSTKLFDRNIQVVIGTLGKDKRTLIKIPKEIQRENLKIDFSVNYAFSEVSSGDNHVTLYNLSDQTQSFISSAKLSVQLWAGYGTILSKIFDGNALAIETAPKKDDETRTLLSSGAEISRQNYSLETKIKLGNHTYYLNDAVFVRTYDAPVETKQVVLDSVGTFGLPYEGIDVIPQKQLAKGFSSKGTTRALYNQILPPIGVNWFVEKGIIRFSKIGEAVRRAAVVASYNTGLIELPVKTEKGLKVKMLFNPDVELSKLMKVDLNAGRAIPRMLFNEFDGNYKIVDVTHEGSNYDGEMTTTAKVERI